MAVRGCIIQAVIARSRHGVRAFESNEGILELWAVQRQLSNSRHENAATGRVSVLHGMKILSSNPVFVCLAQDVWPSRSLTPCAIHSSILTLQIWGKQLDPLWW